MKLLFSRNATTNFLEEISHVGLLKGIFLRIYGTANSGQTMAISDIGNIRFQVNGQQDIFISTTILQAINSMWYGFMEASSVSASAFSFALFVPFEVPDFPNSRLLQPSDDVYLGIDMAAAVATKVSSWTIEAYGIPGTTPEWYQMKLQPANRYSVAGTSRKQVPGENIFRVWLNGTYITDVQLERDGELLYSAKYAAIKAETSRKNRVESALVSYLELETGETVNDFLTDNVELQVITSQSDTVLIQFLSIGLNGSRKSDSLRYLTNELTKRNSNIRAKRPADVVQVETVPSLGSAKPRNTSVL